MDLAQSTEAIYEERLSVATRQMNEHSKETFIIMEEQPKINDKIVAIKNVQSDEIIEVELVRDKRGNQTYKNLPPELEDLMFNFSNDEIWDNFLQVMECLATMHSMLRPDT